MTWWALQKAASPARCTLSEQHRGGVAREGGTDGADDTSEDEHGKERRRKSALYL